MWKTSNSRLENLDNLQMLKVSGLSGCWTRAVLMGY